ncbi:MAG: hypothetical protein ABIQ32_13125 [Sphingomicrobium sp.]
MMIKAMRHLRLPLKAAIVSVGLATAGVAQTVPLRVQIPRLTPLPQPAPEQTEYTEVVACPSVAKYRIDSADGWQGSSNDAELGNAYTAEQGTRQVLYCYYKPGGLLTRVVEPDHCQPLDAALFKKSFLCKK